MSVDFLILKTVGQNSSTPRRTSAQRRASVTRRTDGDEGFEPPVEHVENMIDCLLGVIDDDEFFRRSYAEVRRTSQSMKG